MATRSTKRGINEPPQLSHIESLLIAQGVWEMGLGPSTWSAIARILSKHPLVTRPKSFFTAQSCHIMYNHLMQEAGLEPTEENNVPKADANLPLAEKHYKLRYDELRQLIIAEENAFKTILKEIEDIKAGKWDAQIKSNLTGQEPAGEESPPVDERPIVPVDSGGDEAFSGSDLSGVTETPSPSLDESETPMAKTVTRETEEPQEVSSQSTIDGVQARALAPPIEANTMEVEAEEGKEPGEAPPDLSAADQPGDRDVTQDASPQVSDKGTEQLRREEEEEEEDTTTNKPEEEETDHEDSEPEVAVEDVEGLTTQVVEHKPEEEEEEEETRETLEEHEEMEVEETLPPENETSSSGTSSAEREEHGEQGEQEQGEQEEQEERRERQAQEEQEVAESRQPVEEGAASDEEPVQTTRRSTRNKISAPSGPVTRKTRRQRRVSEPEIQSPAATEAENADADEIKAETPEEDHPSSPVPVEPIGPRRRKRKASIVENVESPRDRKRQREESEPVEDDEPGPSATGRSRRRGDRSEEQVALKKFQNVIGMLHSQISQHRNGNIFHNPIRTVEAPDYHDIVKRPMDLKTIKGRVKDGLIANSLEYQRDIFLMFANAMMYNRPGSDVYHMAEDMMHESEGYINAFRQTEGLVRGRP